MLSASSPESTLSHTGNMPSALRAMALSLGAPDYAGLSMNAVRRLSLVCTGFAELIQTADTSLGATAPFAGSARFLLSALASLRADDALLSERDEAWMIAEVESEFSDALALFNVQMRPQRDA